MNNLPSWDYSQPDDPIQSNLLLFVIAQVILIVVVTCLQCVYVLLLLCRGFPFFNYKCMKKGSMQEDKSNWAESPFGWFDADVLFDDQK